MKIYKRKLIENEYNLAAAASEEFQKVKWGSQEKMYNRFRLVLETFDFNEVGSWLDVGSGTGGFQSVVCPLFPRITATGIDISAQLVEYAKNRNDLDHRNVKFRKIDFLEHKENGFDLVTCIGVLQKTNISSGFFFKKAFEKLNPSGRLYLDTKNIKWEKFKDPNCYPERTHQWFDPKDLISDAYRAGFSDILVKGFIPDDNKVVRPNDSHTIYLTAIKRN